MYNSSWSKRFYGILSVLGFFQDVWAEPFVEEVEDVLVEQIENQQREEDAELSRPESVPLGQIQAAWDKASPGAGVYTISYQPDRIIRLKTRPFVTTTIVLPEWEKIKDILIGDDELFLSEKKEDNIVSLLSKSEGCDTSLTIIGQSGNVYGFYVRSDGIHSLHVPDLVVYVKSYLSRDSKNFFSKKQLIIGSPDYIDNLPFSPDNLTFSFEMSARDKESQNIAPEFVYSDGIWTWLDFESRWNTLSLPVVYQIIDGVDTPVNTRIVGTKIIVQGSGPLTLKSGQKIVCITPVKG